jgi:hypothetical protein
MSSLFYIWFSQWIKILERKNFLKRVLTPHAVVSHGLAAVLDKDVQASIVLYSNALDADREPD